MFIFTGYLDESGTHDGSPVTVMGGLLARADQWQRFQKGFDLAKKKHGFRVFHTKKFKKKSGDFKGWTDQQCLALMDDLGDLIGAGLTDGAATSWTTPHMIAITKATGGPTRPDSIASMGCAFEFASIIS
jgi:hypothetical protein